MSSEPSPIADDETVTLNAVLSIGAENLRVGITVPTRPVPLSDFLPIFRALSEAVVGRAVQAVEKEGKAVSCRKGCGACCRQLVPISEIEARQLHALVEALPEPRRNAVRARFAAARERLEGTEILEKLRAPERFSDGALKVTDLGLAYFGLGIPCPFLEEESCSIHPDRPIKCREYLVTSPAEHCAEPSLETVKVVPLAGKVSTAITLMNVEPGRRFTRWVPLILALEWVESHPDDVPPRTGPEWLTDFLARLTGVAIPTPE